MVIKSLSIRNLGGIDFFTYDFLEGLNVIKSRATDELTYAIQIVLNSKATPSLPILWARRDTRIEASVYASEKYYRLEATLDEAQTKLKLRAYNEAADDITAEYLYLSSHCEEQDLSEVFEGNEKTCFLRFLKYTNEDYFYSPNELSKNTDGFSDIKTFRSYLLSYVKSFRPERIREGKQYEIVLKNNGVYDVQCSDGGELPAHLSGSEQKLFQYLCFLRTAEFWRGFEEIRNIHGIKKPLLIKDFLERLDESIDVGDLIKRTMNLKRQVILLTLPGESRTEKELWKRC